jgi:D-alanyl-D-alanine carboxypeptidase
VQPGIERAIVFVSDYGHSAVVTVGSPRPSANERFPVGSVTKSFTATIVLQLVQEKKLRLKGTLGHYLPGVVRYGDAITIRELLQHRSGLRNYTNSAFVSALSAPSTRPIDALRVVGSKPLDFEPGLQWEYSNTNYIALGLIIEKVTGHSYADELASRILKPLGLHATSLATGRESDSNLRIPTPNLARAAGGILSDGKDLARFYLALLSGRLLSRPMLTEMEKTDPDGGSLYAGFTTISNTYVGDGLGIFATDTPCGRFWGHSGSAGPWITSASANVRRARTVIVAVRVRSSLSAAAGDSDPRPLFCSSY